MDKIRHSKKKKKTDKLGKRAGLNYVLAAGDTLIFIDIKTFRLKGLKKKRYTIQKMTIRELDGSIHNRQNINRQRRSS